VVRGLEGRLLAAAWQCKPQEIANTLWAYAALGLTPKEGVLTELEARLCLIQMDFCPANKAKILWAYKTLALTVLPNVQTALRVCRLEN